MMITRKHSGESGLLPIFFHVMDDSVDAAILAEVSRDPRATLAQLSERVGLGVSAVQARLRRLESSGVITGYRVVLDPEAVGRSLSAFIEITPLQLIAW